MFLSRLGREDAGHIKKLKLVVERKRVDVHGQEGQVLCRVDLGKDDGAFSVVVEEMESHSMLICLVGDKGEFSSLYC